jgi:hypothetical protein
MPGDSYSEESNGSAVIIAVSSRLTKPVQQSSLLLVNSKVT